MNCLNERVCQYAMICQCTKTMSLWDRLPAELQRKVQFDARRVVLAEQLAAMPKAEYEEPDFGGCSLLSVVLRTPNGTVMIVGKQDNAWYEFVDVESCTGWEICWHRAANGGKWKWFATDVRSERCFTSSMHELPEL